MKVVVADTAGFCFGVKNAVDKVKELLGSDEQIYTYGPIIHNTQMVDYFMEKGVRVANCTDDVDRPGKIVIRAHGVMPDVYDELRNKGMDIIDATCPYVKKIQMLAKDHHEKGFKIIIIGDREHPEVMGINGWCENSAVILENEMDAEGLEGGEEKVCVLGQTTLTREKWETVNKMLKNKFHNIIMYDTICSATSARQKEAEEIAKTVDAMIVIGGKNSSNTNKLYEICKKYCNNTFRVETVGDLLPLDIKHCNRVGITAGASTPDWIIKEVIKKMSELSKQDNGMSFQEIFEDSLVTLKTGQIVKGKIIGFNNAEVYIDMGFKSDGIIPMEEFTDDPDFKPEESLKTGEEIDVFVVRVNDGEGNVILSKKKVDAVKGWDKIEEAYENKTPIKVKVLQIVNGGLIASTFGVRVFIPASQVSDRFTKDLSEYVNKVFNVRIIEYNKAKKKIVGSQRVILEEEKSRSEGAVWDNIEVGKEFTGVVKSITDFGVFVDIGGVDGLVHVSELSWTKIKHPSDIMKIGDSVKVRVFDFDKEKKRISLGYKRKEDNPWNKAAAKYNTGDVVKGKVVRLVPFGAFLELDEGVDGLVHISQISNTRIAKPSDVLQIGQIVEAQITELNLEAKKIGLSIKAVNPIDLVSSQKEDAEEVKNPEDEVPSEYKEDMNISIGDLLNTEKTEE